MDNFKRTLNVNEEDINSTYSTEGFVTKGANLLNFLFPLSLIIGASIYILGIFKGVLFYNISSMLMSITFAIEIWASIEENKLKKLGKLFAWIIVLSITLSITIVIFNFLSKI